jgi:hypothetical protein
LVGVGVFLDISMKKEEHERRAEPVPLDAIRVETTLSRYPIHRLTRQGTVRIAIRETDAGGELTVRWEVGHHSEYGQPGLLAYKLDTLIVNRKLDEVGRPVPRLICLGSLSDLCRRLGLPDSGKNIRDIKRALYQNAFAAITAKIRYKARNGAERWIEIGTTRYTVVFTGERLPDGRTADGVYLILNDFYREILDTAPTRPLDYDYLRDLPPVAQRWYELASYSMFAALNHSRPQARLSYAEFCLHAPQTRYLDFEHVKKQMYKVHAPHRQSGYIAGVAFEATTDRHGRPDWALIYTPGPKARAEFQAFTKKGGPVLLGVEPPRARPEPLLPAQAPPTAVEPAPMGLAAELVARGVSRAVAAELVREFPEDRLRRQIEVVDWLRETKPKRVKDVGAYLAKAIREDYAVPAGFEGKAGRAARETAERAALDREVEAREARARERDSEARIKAFLAALTPDERAALDTEALAGAAPADRAVYAAAAAPVRRLLLVGLRDALLRHRLGLPAAD